MDCLYALNYNESMAELDRRKETIAYLKLWLGTMIVSIISLFSWVLSNIDNVSNLKFYCGIIAISLFAAGIVIVHKHIEELIQSLGDL